MYVPQDMACPNRNRATTFDAGRLETTAGLHSDAKLYLIKLYSRSWMSALCTRLAQRHRGMRNFERQKATLWNRGT